MRTVSPSFAPSSRSRLSTPILARIASKRPSPLVAFEIGHRGETFDPVAADDERAVGFDRDLERFLRLRTNRGVSALTTSGGGALAIVRNAANKSSRTPSPVAAEMRAARDLRAQLLEMFARVGKVDLRDDRERRAFAELGFHALSSFSITRLLARISSSDCDPSIKWIRTRVRST